MGMRDRVWRVESRGRTVEGADGAHEEHPWPIRDVGGESQVDEATSASNERLEGGERNVEIDTPR